MENVVRMLHVASTFKSSCSSTMTTAHVLDSSLSVNGFQSWGHRTPPSGIYRPHTAVIRYTLGNKLPLHHHCEDGSKKSTHVIIWAIQNRHSHYCCFYSVICCEKAVSVALKARLCIIVTCYFVQLGGTVKILSQYSIKVRRKYFLFNKGRVGSLDCIRLENNGFLINPILALVDGS